jgi:hypothetical protein
MTKLSGDVLSEQKSAAIFRSRRQTAVLTYDDRKRVLASIVIPYSPGDGSKMTFRVSLDEMLSGLLATKEEILKREDQKLREQQEEEKEEQKVPAVIVESYQAKGYKAIEKALSNMNKFNRLNEGNPDAFLPQGYSFFKNFMELFDNLRDNLKPKSIEHNLKPRMTREEAKPLKTYDEYRASILSEEHQQQIQSGFEVIKSLSVLAIYPDIMKMLAEKSNVSTPFSKDHLLFTFAFRKALTKLAFETIMQTVVHNVLRIFVEGTPEHRLELVKDVFGATFPAGGMVKNEELAKLEKHLDVLHVGGVKPLLDMSFGWAEFDETNERPWLDAAAFVGFNRLLSPTNSAGVAISSDIDFKLVFDPDTIYIKGSHGSQEIADMLGNTLWTNETIFKDKICKLVVALLNTSLKKKEGDFEAARMTLEVEDYTKELTTEDLSLLGIRQNPNFLASIYYNNVRIAGSERVYEKFKTILEDSKNKEGGLAVAMGTFTQYLGESSKGSIRGIHHLDTFKLLIDECVPPLRKLLTKYRKTINPLWLKRVLERGDDYLKLPHVCWQVLQKKTGQQEIGDPPMSYAEALFEDTAVFAEADKLRGMMHSMEYFGESIQKYAPTDLMVRRLETVSKLYSTLADEQNDTSVDLASASVSYIDLASASLSYIGSELANEASWRYSLKYAGCRLNDFFNSVPAPDYLEWSFQFDFSKDCDIKAGRRYLICQQIAEAINRFSLSMQSAIYLAASHPRTSGGREETHRTIDNLYSRLTKERYEEIWERMMAEENVFVHLPSQFENLQKSMALSLQSNQWKVGSEVAQAIFEVKEWAAIALLTTTKPASHKPLFDALFQLVFATASHLHPNHSGLKDAIVPEGPNLGSDRNEDFVERSQFVGSRKNVFVTGTNLTDQMREQLLEVASVLISKATKKIEPFAFADCELLVSVTFMTPSLVDTISTGAFARCPLLRSIALPPSVKTLLDNCFLSCSSLESVRIPPALTEMQTSVFSGCSALKAVTFTDDSRLERIRSSAFASCLSLQSITIPRSVKSIEASAFLNCKSLESIKFLGSVEISIENEAFKGCENLKIVMLSRSIENKEWDFPKLENGLPVIQYY